MKIAKTLAAVVISTVLLACSPSGIGEQTAASTDPLPSWNDGDAKTAIVDFVARVTDRASPDFVPEAERIATFDNDGTLWAEQPLYFQLAFAIDRVKAMALASGFSCTTRIPSASGPTTATLTSADSTEVWMRPRPAAGWWSA